jgi:hypothetical protein
MPGGKRVLRRCVLDVIFCDAKNWSRAKKSTSKPRLPNQTDLMKNFCAFARVLIF